MRGEDCRFRILQLLYNGGAAGFEEIINAVGAARRTTNKYLGALYKQRLVAKLYGKTGKYYLTKEGKAEAERQKRRREWTTLGDKLPIDHLEKEIRRLKRALALSLEVEAGFAEYLDLSIRLYDEWNREVPKYLFGLTYEQVSQYFKEYYEEVGRLVDADKRRILNQFDELVTSSKDRSAEELRKLWEDRWEEHYKRYSHEYNFIVWLKEKKGLKIRV